MGIRITPLSGAKAEGSPPLSVLVEIDEGRILLDCGCPERPAEPFNGICDQGRHSHQQQAHYMKALTDLAPTLDLVVLSHARLSSVGMLPFLRASLGLRCPVYATLPTKEMGRWAAEEWIGQRAAEEPLGAQGVEKTSLPDTTEAHAIVEAHDPFLQASSLTTHQVREAFDSVIAVRYSQPILLAGRLKSLTLIARRAGHSLGCSLWSLRSPLHGFASASSATLIYAPIFNHVKERHINGSALLSNADGNTRLGEGVSRPGVLLVSADRCTVKGLKRKDRDSVILDSITKTLRASRSVLIPTDASSRLFELLALLEQHWSYSRLEGFPLCLVSRTGHDVVAYLHSLTEWLGGSLVRGSHEGLNSKERDSGLLKFRHLKCYPSPEAMEAELPAGVPKLVLVTPISFSYGFSRRVLVDFARVPGNLLLLTERGASGTLLRHLVDVVDEKQLASAKWGQGQVPTVVTLEETIGIQMRSKVVLTGEELHVFYEAKRKAEERRSKHEAILARSRRMVNEDDESDESDSDDEGEREVGPLRHPSTKPTSSAVTAAHHLNAPGVLATDRSAWDEFVDDKVAEGLSFDIYVQVAFSRNSSNRAVAQRFRMFPFIERRRRVDAYGEKIDVEGWIKRNDTVAEASATAVLGKRRREQSEEQVEEPPFKFETTQETLQLACDALAIDMEGKADGRAIKTLIPQINPKRVIFVGGSQNSVQDALGTLSTQLSAADLASPDCAQTCEVGEDVKSFTVKLGDGVLSSLRISRLEGFDVAHLSGQIDVRDSVPVLNAASVPSRSGLGAKVTKSAGEVVADHNGTNLGSLSILDRAVLVGDLKLATLKARLASVGIPASFGGEGILVCGPVTNMPGRLSEGAQARCCRCPSGTVAVKKVGRGELIVEGVAGVALSAVRRVVYSLHAGV